MPKSITFWPTKWESVEQKTKFFRHFKKFMMSGCKPTLFYKWFYNRLHMTFGHMAHYDQNGFYEVWFSDSSAIQSFINHCLAYPCYGDPEYTYSDVEEALQDWLVANKRNWDSWANKRDEEVASL